MKRENDGKCVGLIDLGRVSRATLGGIGDMIESAGWHKAGLSRD